MVKENCLECYGIGYIIVKTLTGYTNCSCPVCKGYKDFYWTEIIKKNINKLSNGIYPEINLIKTNGKWKRIHEF